MLWSWLVSQIFNQFFFQYHYFFQPIPIGNAISRRFYICQFLAKRYSLGVTGVFIQSMFYQIYFPSNLKP